jgi:hypothetical protein
MDKPMKSPKRIIKSTNQASGENLSNNSSGIIGRTNATGEERHQLIARAAYLRAEQRGFSPGSELEDCLTAENEIDEMLIKSGAQTKGAS